MRACLLLDFLANDSNFDRNPLRGCNYGLEGGAFLILVGCSSLPKEECTSQQKMDTKAKEMGREIWVIDQAWRGIGHSELNGCQIVKRIGRSLLIECFWRIYSSLIWVQDHPVFGMLLFEFKQIPKAADVGHPVSALGWKRMADDLVVPQIHIQRQLIIYALHICLCVIKK